jgi:cytoskeletal protein CcmA (bactofilin family)
MLCSVAAIWHNVRSKQCPEFTHLKGEIGGFMLDERVDDSFASVPDQVPQARPGYAGKSSVSAVSAPSMIGKTLVIKGEITGSESVYIEGTVEGSIMLPDDRVTVGSSGRVSADITAQDIVVLGELTGSCDAGDHLYVRREGSLCGDIVTARISVEDGAYLTGTVDIRTESTSALRVEEEELVESSHVN